MVTELSVPLRAEIVIVIIACAIPLVSSANNDVMAVLKNIGSQCAAEHDYDWQRPGTVDEKALAVGEKAWRQCVYAGIRRDIIPTSNVGDEYERIIERDIEFTKAVEAGEMTRVERWRRNQKARDIVLVNEAIAEQTGKDLEKELANKQQRQLSEFMNDQIDLMLRVQTLPSVMR